MMQTMMIVYGGFVALMILVVLALVISIGVSRIVVALRARRDKTSRSRPPSKPGPQ